MNSRNQSLDALRGLAILLVLGRHFTYYALWTRIGWIGVPLFFVLSGFLVSGLLFNSYKQSGELHIRRFILRRGLKIWPAFYVVLLFMLGFCLFGHAPVPWAKFAICAAFLQNYSSGLTPGLGHFWSLAVEEHFYLILPLLLFVLVRARAVNPFSPLPTISAFFIVACLAMRYFETPAGQQHQTHLRIDGLFAGVTLGYWFHFRQEIFARLARSWSPVGGILLCLPAFWLEPDSRAMQTVGVTMLTFGFSLLTAWCVWRTPQTYAARKFCGLLAKVGYYSYSIYLWHVVLGALSEAVFGHTAFGFWLYVLLAIAGGIIMAKAIEIPFLQWREKIAPAATAARGSEAHEHRTTIHRTPQQEALL